MKGISKYWNKISLRVTLAIVITFFFGACQEPDPFPLTPQVQFNDMEFVEIIENGNPDSLILHFDFQDGDGDLGIEGNEDFAPFHDFDLILDNDQNFVTIGQENLELPLFRFTPGLGITGQFSATDNRPSFDCSSYDTLYIKNDRSEVFPPGTPFEQIDLTEFYRDTVYIARNPFKNNIEVRFFRKRGADNYEEIDWRYLTSPFGCGISFDGRFPILDPESASNSSSLEGTIRYAMVSTGFRTVLRKDTFNIQFRVFDRNLNESNMAETGDITLDQLIR